MALRLGDIAPNFETKTNLGTLDFYEYLGDSWGVLFSHPADFTPVCTTELGKTAALTNEFLKRNVKPIAVSVDDVESHNRWILDINETQKVDVKFPIVADEDKKVALLYTYPSSTGRNFTEVLRVIDSLQLTDSHKLATPADWKNGEECIVVPAVSTEQAKEIFGDVNVVKPYLRYVKQPQ